jgi:hypothetical protein
VHGSAVCLIVEGDKDIQAAGQIVLDLARMS